MQLQVETSDKQLAERASVAPDGSMMIFTPPVGEDYWLYRVKLSDEQALLAFPKFFTVGIGFAKEADWNTNLPWNESAEAEPNP